jgi:hypothetical protein
MGEGEESEIEGELKNNGRGGGRDGVGGRIFLKMGEGEGVKRRVKKMGEGE